MHYGTTPSPVDRSTFMHNKKHFDSETGPPEDPSRLSQFRQPGPPGCRVDVRCRFSPHCGTAETAGGVICPKKSDCDEHDCRHALRLDHVRCAWARVLCESFLMETMTMAAWSSRQIRASPVVEVGNQPRRVAVAFQKRKDLAVTTHGLTLLNGVEIQRRSFNSPRPLPHRQIHEMERDGELAAWCAEPHHLPFVVRCRDRHKLRRRPPRSHRHRLIVAIATRRRPRSLSRRTPGAGSLQSPASFSRPR